MFFPRQIQLSRNEQTGFSLLELIVTIAIIATLFTFIFPTFQRSVATSKNTKCLGQLRQIWNRMLIYTNENQGSFPYAHTVEGYRFWPQDINAAAGTQDIASYICPSIKKENLNKNLRELKGGYAYVSYGINFYGISASTATSRKDAPAHMIDLQHPEKTLAIIDCDDLSQPYTGWYIAYGGRLRDEWNTVAARHQGRLNGIFCDGHAESMSKEALYTHPLNQEPWAQFIYLRERE